MFSVLLVFLMGCFIPFFDIYVIFLSCLILTRGDVHCTFHGTGAPGFVNGPLNVTGVLLSHSTPV